MALNPTLINFFIEHIGNSRPQTFGAEVKHLYNHLNNEVKDNLVYNKYLEQSTKWQNWPENKYEDWTLPDNFENTKSLVFALYKNIAENPINGYQLPLELFATEGKLISSIHTFNNQFLSYLKEALQEIINANPEIEDNSINKVKGDKVFIVHGHDDKLKIETQLLLTRGGVNNIVLHERPDLGRTIIDKLIQESADANYAIVLLSPDDKLIDGTERSRQNVVLEAGYFMGKIGKERVRLVRKTCVNIPSDLSGILYENYDDSGAWKIKLMKELFAAGIYVDMKSIMDNF